MNARSPLSILAAGRPFALALSVLLSGCASFSPDSGMGLVADVSGQTLKKTLLSCARRTTRRKSTGECIACCSDNWMSRRRYRWRC